MNIFNPKNQEQMMNTFKTLINSLLCTVLLGGCGDSVAQNPSTDTNTHRQGAVMLRESPSNPQLRKLSGEKIHITVGNKTMLVELYNNSAANDLLTKLPLTFNISDYAGWDEKLIRLDRKNALSMKDYTGGDDPAIPELGYYEPGNWIALYFGHIGYWSGKIPLGKIHAAPDEIKALKDGASVTIERAK